MALLDGFEVLLAHFTGTDGQRTYTADTGQVATFDAATGHIEQDIYKFAPTALALDGNSDFISFPHSADWAFGSGNFKIDLQVYFTALPNSSSGGMTFFRQGDNTHASWMIYYYKYSPTNYLEFRYTTNGTTVIPLTFTWLPSINTMYHVCITKVGTTLRCFIDGTQIGVNKTLSGTIYDDTNDLYIGKQNYTTNQRYFQGYLDEIHISKGGTGYEVADFTPPASPYDVSIPTLLTEEQQINYPNSTLNGNITNIGGINCDERGFDWGTSSGIYTYNWTETDSGDFEAGTFNHIITELIEGQTYYFRAKARNSEGWGYGEELSFIVTAYDIITNSATDIDTTIATLQGAISNLTEGYSVLANFEYWKVSESGETGSITETPQVEITNNGAFSANIDNLDNHTNYTYRAKAILIDSGATEQYGENTLFETLLIDIRNVIASQRTSDGKVEINFDTKFTDFLSAEDQLYIKFQYWNGSTWQECTTTTGEGLQTVTPSEWTSLSGTWNAKTDIPETYYAATKIRALVSYDNIEWNYKDSANFALDVKNPIINTVSPADVATQILVRFPFVLGITDNSDTQIKIEISLIDGVGFTPIITSDWIDGDTWAYYNDIRPLMYGTYYWRATVKDIYQNTAAVSSIYEFTVQDSNTEVRIDSIIKETTGSGVAKILYSIKDPNHEKISVRFDYTENDGDTYHPCEIIEISSGTIEDDCFITDLVATPAYVQYWAKVQYSNDPEIQIVTEELKKKNLKVSSKVYITRDGTDIDISNIVSSVDLSRSKQFGAAQLTTRCIDKDLSYNPNDTTSANNIVSSLYNPLIYIGNIIKFSFKFMTSSGLKTYNKFIGYINNVELSKNSVGKNSINITSQDYLQKLMNYMPENLEYKTTKMEIVDELVKTFDGITYYAEFGSWAEYPAPIVKINDVVLGYDKYIIDFARGQIIYKGNTLANLVTQTQICTNPSADRKTWILNIATDNSIQPKVYRTYQRYESFSCNDYTGSFNQWVDYTEELHEVEDYYIDYDNGEINLYEALSSDQTGKVVGNINNQQIIITYKETTIVKVTYSYEIAGSNEVEDIIRDLATKAGIAISVMQDTITNEDLILRNNNSLYTKYNNIDSLVLYKNGDMVGTGEYELTERDGIIELVTQDANSKNKVIEDCDYLWDLADATESGETTVQEIDTINKEEGIGSLKVTFPTNGGYVLRNLIGDFYNCSITTQKYIEFWIKADKVGTVYLDVSYNNINWLTKTINTTTTWTKVQWDISAFAASYKDLNFLKLRGTDIEVWIDNIYIKRNLYTATYTYYTLQATGITLSKVIMDYENTENAFSGIQDLLKNVAPNYLLYFDDNNKLVGYYSNQRLLRNCVNCWSNFSEGNRGYSRSYYGEHYRLNLPTNLVHNISDEEVYTGCIVIGKNTEPQNVALKGTITDDCSWVTGKGYALAVTKTARGQYDQSKAAISGGDIIFQQLNAQNTTELNEDAIDTLLDFDANTGYQWYKANEAPTPNILMCTLELETAILWDRIDILVGSYDGKVIKEMLYITVGDETGTNWWYTEKNKLKAEGGASGSWITFENNFNQNIKIKYVRVYMSEPWNWTTTTTTSGGKGGGGSSSASTDYFYAFSLGEIEVWEKATLIGKRTLDNVLLVGDGLTYEVQIPNTPYKTKDFLEYKWGWVEKYPESIELYSNSFSNKLIPDTDYVYDKTNGMVSFNNIPAIGDVISGTWTLDDKDPKATTFYTSFTNIDLIRRIGLKYYKEVDDGLFNHNQTINRAGEILPELSRSVFPGNIDIVYRPDIKLGQSVLVVNEELSLNRIFYVDSINLGIEGFMPKCSLGITSYLELKDYEYQEIAPGIYGTWKFYYPKYLPAFASHEQAPGTHNEDFFTGTLAVEALGDTGEVLLNYGEECKLEILTLEDSFTSVLSENIIKSEMWKLGKAELNFYIQWNTEGLGGRANTPADLLAENKSYVDKNVVFKFYEVNNPNKFKQFSTKIRFYLVGTLKSLSKLGNLGEFRAYDNYNITTASTSITKEGKYFVTDIFDRTNVLSVDSAAFLSFITSGQSIFAISTTVAPNYYQIKQYDWSSLTWINWGITFYSYNTPYLLDIIKGKFIIKGTFAGHPTYMSLWDGKNMVGYMHGILLPIFNNQIYAVEGSGLHPSYIYTDIYDANGILVNAYLESSEGYNEKNYIVFRGNLYMFTNRDFYTYSQQYQGELGIRKWNTITHVWDNLYHFIINNKEHLEIGKVFEYKNKVYLTIHGIESGLTGYWYLPMICEYDVSTNKIYRKGYLLNADWGDGGSRASRFNKYPDIFGNVWEFQGQLYAQYNNYNIINLMPYLECERREEVFPNQL